MGVGWDCYCNYEIHAGVEMPKVRRQYSGGAVATTLAAPVGASAVTTFNVAGGSAPSGWPSSAGVPFFVVLSPQTSVEEKMLVTLSGPTLTIVSRGLDGTSAGSHASGASIYPVFTATDADEANELTSKYSTQGSIVHQGASTFTELAVGTAAHVLKVNAGATAPEWGQVATAGIADSAITSAKILDGTIVLADLAASLQAFLCPVGTINAYAGATAPTGWLLCNGTSTTGYAALAALVGATTPDMRGLFPIGKTASSTGSTLLGTGGSTTITSSNMPSHTHTQDSHNHTQNSHNHTQDAHNHTQDSHNHTQDAHDHTANSVVTFTTAAHLHDNADYFAAAVNGGSVTSGGGTSIAAATATNQATTATNQATTATNQVATATNIATTATNQHTGGGTAYFQPFIAVNYIIKHD
jgi:microcystin-dependent protein